MDMHMLKTHQKELPSYIVRGHHGELTITQCISISGT